MLLCAVLLCCAAAQRPIMSHARAVGRTARPAAVVLESPVTSPWPSNAHHGTGHAHVPHLAPSHPPHGYGPQPPASAVHPHPHPPLPAAHTAAAAPASAPNSAFKQPTAADITPFMMAKLARTRRPGAAVINDDDTDERPPRGAPAAGGPASGARGGGKAVGGSGAGGATEVGTAPPSPAELLFAEAAAVPVVRPRLAAGAAARQQQQQQPLGRIRRGAGGNADAGRPEGNRMAPAGKATGNGGARGGAGALFAGVPARHAAQGRSDARAKDAKQQKPSGRLVQCQWQGRQGVRACLCERTLLG